MRMLRARVYIRDARKQETGARGYYQRRLAPYFVRCARRILIFTVRDVIEKEEMRKIAPELNMKEECRESSPFQWRRVPLISSIIRIEVFPPPHSLSLSLSERSDDYLISVPRLLEIMTTHLGNGEIISKTISFLIYLFLSWEKVLMYWIKYRCNFDDFSYWCCCKKFCANHCGFVDKWV